MTGASGPHSNLVITIQSAQIDRIVDRAEHQRCRVLAVGC